MLQADMRDEFFVALTFTILRCLPDVVEDANL
jgi:hypothetical protein